MVSAFAVPRKDENEMGAHILLCERGNTNDCITDRMPQRAWQKTGFLFILSTLFANSALAGEGPEIQHQEIEFSAVEQDIVVVAQIVDPDGVFDPVLLYRAAGRGSFSRLEMKKTGENTYEAVIPATFVTTSIEYFIEAYDVNGDGPSRFGEEDFPIEIRVPVADDVFDDGSNPADEFSNLDLEMDGDEESVLDGNNDEANEGQKSSAEKDGKTTSQKDQPRKLDVDEAEGPPWGLYAGMGVGVGAVVLVVAAAVTGAVAVGIWWLWPSTAEPPPDEVEIQVGAPLPVSGLLQEGAQ